MDIGSHPLGSPLLRARTPQRAEIFYPPLDEGMLLNEEVDYADGRILSWRWTGRSLRHIVEELNKLAITAKRGGRLYPCKVSYLLRNSLYA
jgi:hypothetical protein